MVEYLEEPDPGSDVVLVEYDAGWPDEYARQQHRIVTALGDPAAEVHHAGSTSVPGLAAKPVIDVILVVADPADEAAYAPALQGAGYTFTLREPEWHRHRLFKDRSPRVNLHVFGPGALRADQARAGGAAVDDRAGLRRRQERCRRRDHVPRAQVTHAVSGSRKK